MYTYIMKNSKPSHETVIEILQDMGMTELEANVYSFIFKNGGATSRDILRALDLRQPQLYDITSGLERKGFVNVIVGRPQRYEAINPEIIYENREENLKQMRGTFLDWVKKNAPAGYKGEPEIFISRNINGFLSNTLDIIKKANQYIFIHTTLSYLVNFLDYLEEKSRRGVRVFLLLFDDGYEEGFFDEIMKKNIFSNIRYTRIGKFFAVISDESYSAFMPRNILLGSRSEQYGYIFKDDDMTWFLIHNFFSGWFSSSVIDERMPEMPAEYDNQRIAITDIISLKNKGVNKIEVTIDGEYRKNGVPVILKGLVSNININEDVVNFTMKGNDGKEISIGGFDSKIEDVIAHRITIENIK